MWVSIFGTNVGTNVSIEVDVSIKVGTTTDLRVVSVVASTREIYHMIEEVVLQSC